jgi:flagellar hook-length control protein FliK
MCCGDESWHKNCLFLREILGQTMTLVANILPTGSMPNVAGNAEDEAPANGKFSIIAQILSGETKTAEQATPDKKADLDIISLIGNNTGVPFNTTGPIADGESTSEDLQQPQQGNEIQTSEAGLLTASLILAGQTVQTPVETEQTGVDEQLAQDIPTLTQPAVWRGQADLPNTVFVNAGVQNASATIQNTDSKATDETVANAEISQSELFQQAANPVKKSAVKESGEQQTKNTTGEKTVDAQAISNSQTADVQPENEQMDNVDAQQTDNAVKGEGQAEKTTGKNNQSKGKTQQIHSLQNQQADTQKITANLSSKTQTPATDNQKKSRVQTTSGKESGSNVQISSAGSDTVQNKEGISLSEQSLKGNQTLKTDLSEQIQESAKAVLTSNKNQVTIRLNPPELGSISLKVSDNGKQITGLLQISNPDTKYEVQQMLPEIIRNIEDAGISIKRFDVVLNNPSNQQTAQQSLYQQNAQQNNSFGGNSNTGYQNFSNLFDENGLQTISAAQIITSVAGSINILM